MTLDINRLSALIAIRSMVGLAAENQQMLQWLSSTLVSIGFCCRIEGQDTTEQPLLVASFTARKGSADKKLVLYNHYDVAPVRANEPWKSQDPFVLQLIDGRLYGRGIADNKGPLYARIEALSKVVASGFELPNILWLIQGEEEIIRGERVATKLMAAEIAQFAGNVFVEETGFFDIEQRQPLAFLWSPTLPANALTGWQPLLEQTLGSHRLEYRHLNKLNGVRSCPLLSNLPSKAVYIGFGPNDKLHQIHCKNESLDAERLQLYRQQFVRFIRAY
ncbi:MAG: acetylornithine deacetylase/succinyl-diaminopimelate desuccinylase-like protein [Phenylobacterium sp.]|jgi:acetylornithine deacetylase/succinyl-diaminopimelate desuccinylase-like protein